jgi:amino acid adenylation domain-containing protein
MIVAALAILKAGGAYLPIDPSCPADRLAFLLRDAQIRIVVSGQCTASGLPVQIEHIIIVDTKGKVSDNEEPCEPVTTTIEPANLGYVIYTSGSTGQPKGVELTQQGLLNLICWHQSTFKISERDRASQLAALGFDAAVWEIWPYLTAGASVHLVSGIAVNDPQQVQDWLISEGITVTFLPTPLAEQVIALDWPSRPALRLMLTGADTLHHYPSRKLRFQLVNNYGPTECTVVTTSGVVPSNPEHPDQLPTIGRPIANTIIYILDEKMQQVPVGQPGELYVGGKGLARGYRNRPDLTAERFVPDPFSSKPGARLYRTGDLARYLPDGEIAFLGRIDEQIKIRGYRIEPAEIVRALDGHPSVQASAVVARDRDGDKQLVGYFVPSSHAQPTHSELRNFLANRVPDYMIPAVFVKLNSLPFNRSGKVDRAALPAPDSENTLRDHTFVSPGTAIEARVAEILASLLDVGQVSVEDNFFLLGGHSLLGTQLIARVRDAFGIELSLKTLFDAPTVFKLAAQVEALLLAKLEAMSDEEAERLMGGAAPAAA